MRCDRSKTDETEVAKAEMDLPEDSRVMFDDETPDNPMMEDERYAFKATLPLPKSLRECRQDVDSHAINISHRFKLMVNIHNPEGHVSQVRPAQITNIIRIDLVLACVQTASQDLHFTKSTCRRVTQCPGDDAHLRRRA